MDLHRAIGRRAVFFSTTMATLVGIALIVDSAADENSAAKSTSFEKVLEAQLRATLNAVAEYIRANPTADDVGDAHLWLFETAGELGMEQEVRAVAEDYLKSSADQGPARKPARRVLGLGLAQTGKLTDALALFQQDARDLDFRNPDAELDFGERLVEYAQLNGDFAAARGVYDALSSQLFLNQFARSFCELRMRRLELVKQAAPKITVTDIEGKPIDLSEYAGKVVLVDFWASNCEPCLKQLPAMKKLYADYHGKGFEIVGISLDEQPGIVETLQEKLSIPWRLAPSATDGDDTRHRYRAEKIPTMYLVDQKGTIAYADLHGDRMKQAVEKLLNVGK